MLSRKVERIEWFCEYYFDRVFGNVVLPMIELGHTFGMDNGRRAPDQDMGVRDRLK